MDRSLTVSAWDGFEAPRWVHYLTKCLVGAAALSLLVFLVGADREWRAALVSLVWFLSLRVHYWLDHRTDHNAERLFTLDLLCDFALHAAPVAVVLPSPWRALWFAACFIAWVLSYPYASP